MKETGDGRCSNARVHRCVSTSEDCLSNLGAKPFDELTFPSEGVDQALIGEVELGGVHSLVAVGEAVGKRK